MFLSSSASVAVAAPEAVIASEVVTATTVAASAPRLGAAARICIRHLLAEEITIKKLQMLDKSHCYLCKHICLIYNIYIYIYQND